MENQFVIITFYKFVTLSDYESIREPLLKLCEEQGVLGIILLAEEGINSTVASTREGIDALLSYLRSDPRLSDMIHKESYADFNPFKRIKVRLKKEIVTLKRSEADPREHVGVYIEPEDWNDLISDPNILLIDTRNHFETTIGTFRGAVSPNTVSFSEFTSYVEENLDPKQHKKIAMFCTGGIRCEKATSYMVQQGFEEVYHLNGGILRYLEQINSENSMWDGECFVFDQRVSVDHDLRPGKAIFCPNCKELLPDDSKPCVYCGAEMDSAE